MFKMFTKQKGFTLIELMVVIAVLGILAGIAIPRLTGVTERARDVEYKNAAGSVRSAMEMYWADNAEYPAAGSDDGEVDSWDDLDNELDTVELPELDDLGNFSYEDPNAGDDDERKEYKIEITNDSTGTTFTITQDEVEDDS